MTSVHIKLHAGLRPLTAMKKLLLFLPFLVACSSNPTAPHPQWSASLSVNGRSDSVFRVDIGVDSVIVYAKYVCGYGSRCEERLQFPAPAGNDSMPCFATYTPLQGRELQGFVRRTSTSPQAFEFAFTDSSHSVVIVSGRFLAI